MHDPSLMSLVLTIAAGLFAIGSAWAFASWLVDRLTERHTSAARKKAERRDQGL